MNSVDLEPAGFAPSADGAAWVMPPRTWRPRPAIRPSTFLRVLTLDPEAQRRSARLQPPTVVADPDTRPQAWEAAGRHRLLDILRHRAAEVESTLRSSEVTLVRGLAPDPDPGRAAYAGECDPARIAGTLRHVLGAIALMGAAAFAFEDENGGRLVRHVVARPGARGEISSQGWGAELPWHMDGAFRPFQATPDLAPPARWLVFGVIIADPQLPMTVTSVVEAVRRLSPDARLVLGLPEFAVSTPEAVHERRVFQPLPILDRDAQGHLISRLSLGLCQGITARAKAALHEFSEVLDAPDLHHQLDLAPGHLVVLDNWRTLHRRPTYRPAWDGADRWMVRVYASAPAHRLSIADGRRTRR